MNHLEFKTAFGVDDAGTITGTAWPFGSADKSGDIIEKGAFQFATPLPMLFQHDPRDPVGVWDSITESDAGLTVKGRLLVNDIARAREVRAMVQSGLLKGLSIGFSTKKASARPGGGRTIKSLELVEISLVTVPMHPGARVTSAKDASTALAIAEAINRAASAYART